MDEIKRQQIAARRQKLAQDLYDLHAECDIDGYGHEGACYDYDKFITLLMKSGWRPPYNIGQL